MYISVPCGTLRYMPDMRLELDPELLARVDEARGKVPRTEWVRDAIRGRLALDTKRVVKAPEPAPSRPLPPVSKDEVANTKAEAARVELVQERVRTHEHIDPHREFLEERGPATPIPEACSHPKSQRKVFGWGTLCGVCNEKVS